MIIYLQMIETNEEKSKFEQIYLKYRSLMYHIAYQYLRHEQDAEDAVHQAFVKVAENISKISDPECPKTKQFVVIIVENKAKDMLRVRNKHTILPLDEELNGVFEEPVADDTLSGCILKLPEQQRHVIWLKYHHGYNLHEIAKMLDISLSWAQKIDQRAKKKLEELMQAEPLT